MNIFTRADHFQLSFEMLYLGHWKWEGKYIYIQGLIIILFIYLSLELILPIPLYALTTKPKLAVMQLTSFFNLFRQY
jgi:hypothetical protein